MKKYFDKLYKEGQENFERELKYRLSNDIKTFVVTANPETLMIGKENQALNEVLEDSTTMIVPDGIGVVKAGRSLGLDIKGRVTGVEISEYLIKQADQLKKSLYFFGAKEEVVKALVQKVEKDYPGIVIVGYSHGYEKDKDKVFEKIVDLKPDIVLVALGIPLQELLIRRHYEQFEKGIFVGVGGSFDVLSGMKKRAPKIFIALNLEWLYRIVKEPKRIKRFYKNNIKFIKNLKNIR